MAVLICCSRRWSRWAGTAHWRSPGWPAAVAFTASFAVPVPPVDQVCAGPDRPGPARHPDRRSWPCSPPIGDRRRRTPRRSRTASSNHHRTRASHPGDSARTVPRTGARTVPPAAGSVGVDPAQAHGEADHDQLQPADDEAPCPGSAAACVDIGSSAPNPSRSPAHQRDHERATPSSTSDRPDDHPRSRVTRSSPFQALDWAAAVPGAPRRSGTRSPDPSVCTPAIDRGRARQHGLHAERDAADLLRTEGRATPARRRRRSAGPAPGTASASAG